MLKELQTEPFVLVCALNDPWQICEENFRVIHEIRVANIRSESGEGVACDFRKGPRDLQLICVKLIPLGSRVEM